MRGFRQDLEDASRFLDDGLVETERFCTLVRGILDESYSRYPNLSRATVEAAVEDFLSESTALTTAGLSRGESAVRFTSLDTLSKRRPSRQSSLRSDG